VHWQIGQGERLVEITEVRTTWCHGLGLAGNIENRHRWRDLDRFQTVPLDLQHHVWTGSDRCKSTVACFMTVPPNGRVELERNRTGLARLNLLVPSPSGGTAASGRTSLISSVAVPMLVNTKACLTTSPELTLPKSYTILGKLNFRPAPPGRAAVATGFGGASSGLCPACAQRYPTHRRPSTVSTESSSSDIIVSFQFKPWLNSDAKYIALFAPAIEQFFGQNKILQKRPSPASKNEFYLLDVRQRENRCSPFWATDAWRRAVYARAQLAISFFETPAS